MCPCGNPAHNRYNVEKFKLIFNDFKTVHPYDQNDLGPKYAEPHPELYVDPRSGNSATPLSPAEMISHFSSLDVATSSTSNHVPPKTSPFPNTATSTPTESLPMDVDEDPSELVEEGDDQQWGTTEPVGDATNEDSTNLLDSNAMDVL